jgi:hypothetical protein
MEQKKLSVLLLVLCAGSAHGMRLLHDAEYGRDFTFGSRAAATTESAQQDTIFDDYENEISRVEFEPERGTSYAAAVTTAADAPAPGPATAGSDAVTTSTTARPGTGSMKWWLPPSTMPSFPMFPNPGGMPGMPLPAMPVPMPMPGGIPGMPAMPMPVPGGALPGGGLPGMPMPGGMPAPFNFKPTGWGAGAGAGASAGTALSPPAQAQPAPPAASSSASANDNDNANDSPNPTETIIN